MKAFVLYLMTALYGPPASVQTFASEAGTPGPPAPHSATVSEADADRSRSGAVGASPAKKPSDRIYNGI